MATLKWYLIFAAAFYAGLVALMYVAQRTIQYFPESYRTEPSAAGYPEAEEVVLDTADGERVIVWHVPPRGDKPVILYLHGNGASLRWRVDRFRALTADGTGLVALSYRGYGGSSGRPTEEGMIDDARAAYTFAAARYPAERIVLWASRSAPAWRSRWRRKNRSHASCCNRRSPRPPTSARNDIGSCRYAS